jgi:hypothetical protein
VWTNAQFWRDATWRAFRTFCQSLAGLLTVETVSSNLNASWLSLLYASAVAGLISLLQSVDRGRAVGEVGTHATVPVVAAPVVEPAVAAAPVPVVVENASDPSSANYQP